MFFSIHRPFLKNTEMETEKMEEECKDMIPSFCGATKVPHFPDE